MKKLTFLVLVIILSLMSFTRVKAWEQTTHMAINYESIQNFIRKYGEDDKYANSALQFQNIYTGLKVTSSSWFAEPHVYGALGGYEDKVDTMTVAGWIVHGGFSADEPNIYESMRHFYDPLEKNSATHLVAQANTKDDYGEIVDVASDELINPNIDARDWGLSNDQNPYCFSAAIDYYYKAMTISDYDLFKGFEPGDLFRTSAIEAKNHEEERSLYLGAAFRALGETMHLMADMTQPAHVRNDAHPFTEPIEQGTTPGMIAGYLKSGLNVVPEIGNEYYSETFENRQSLMDLFHKTAIFTNKTMFSLDTIADYSLGIEPENGLEAYGSPQLSKLIAISNESFWSGKTTTYYQMINGIEVPMAYCNSSGKYSIPNSFAQKQSEILIPIAIAGCTEVIDRFFPTIELVFEQGETDFIEDRRGRETEQIPFKINMVHHYEEDVEWFERGIEIKYQGPGELIIENELGTRVIPIFFEDGKVIAAKDKRRDIFGEIVLYRKIDSNARQTKDQKFLEVFDGDVVRVEVNAGGRLFVSEELYIGAGDYKIETEPETPFCYEDVILTLTGGSVDKLYCVWDFGDGSEDVKGIGLYEAAHVFKKSGKQRISVTIYDSEKMEDQRAKAYISLEIVGEIDIGIMPANNLQGIPGTSSEIYVESLNDRVSLENYRIEWEIEKVEAEINGIKALLTFDEPGNYDIYAKAYDSEDKLVGTAYAELEVSEDVNIVTVEPAMLNLKAYETTDLSVYLNGEYVYPDNLEFIVEEGEVGGKFIGTTYNAPGEAGSFTIKVVVDEDENLVAYVPVNITSDKKVGRWVLIDVKVEVREPNWKSDSHPDTSGEVIQSEGDYWAKVIYDGDLESFPDYEYVTTAKWGEIPDTLIPGEVLDIDISLSVDGDYEYGRNSIAIRFYSEKNNMKIGEEVVMGKKVEKSLVLSRTIPNFGNHYNEAKELSIQVYVDPWYVWIGNVKYIYNYKYIED